MVAIETTSISNRREVSVPENPFAARDRGTHRVRAVTAALVTASVLGTGAVALVVADSGGTAQASPTPSVQQDSSPGGQQSGTTRTTGADSGSLFSRPARGSAVGAATRRARVMTAAAAPTAADWWAWSCRVRVVVTDPAVLDEARAVLTDALGAVDHACSRFRDDAELAAVEARAGQWVPVSPLLGELLRVAVRAARLTDGDVDPTIGGALAGLGYDRDITVISSTGEVLAAPAPGWRSIELDRAGRRVRIAEGVRVDLGATAKAWAADVAAAEITRRTGAGCLVSLGGDIAVAGAPPRGGWRVRVEEVTGDPSAPPAGPSTLVTVRDGGLATSSTRARRWRNGGIELHHLLDPRTGLPPAPAWRTVTVAAGSCVDANTVSTAAIVRGDRVTPWLRATGLPARLVREDGRVLTVGGWPAERSAA